MKTKDELLKLTGVIKNRLYKYNLTTRFWFAKDKNEAKPGEGQEFGFPDETWMKFVKI